MNLLDLGFTVDLFYSSLDCAFVITRRRVAHWGTIGSFILYINLVSHNLAFQ